MKNLIRLTHHRDQLAAAIQAFKRDCAPMIDENCGCLFCSEIQQAIEDGDNLLGMLASAIDAEQSVQPDCGNSTDLG